MFVHCLFVSPWMKGPPLGWTRGKKGTNPNNLLEGKYNIKMNKKQTRD